MEKKKSVRKVPRQPRLQSEEHKIVQADIQMSAPNSEQTYLSDILEVRHSPSIRQLQTSLWLFIGVF